jgi:hypothetical protein
VRLCKRYRQLLAKGTQAKQVVVAMAREFSAFMRAMAKQVPVAPEAARPLMLAATAGQVCHVDRKRCSPGGVYPLAT